MDIDRFEYREDVIYELINIRDRIAKNPASAVRYRSRVKRLLSIYKHWEEVQEERQRNAMEELC